MVWCKFKTSINCIIHSRKCVCHLLVKVLHVNCIASHLASHKKLNAHLVEKEKTLVWATVDNNDGNSRLLCEYDGFERCAYIKQIWITIQKIKWAHTQHTDWIHSQISLKWFQFVECNCKRSHFTFLHPKLSHSFILSISLSLSISLLLNLSLSISLAQSLSLNISRVLLSLAFYPFQCRHSLILNVVLCPHSAYRWEHDSNEHSFNNLKYHMAISAISFKT